LPAWLGHARWPTHGIEAAAHERRTRLSLGVYVAFGDVQFPYHRWDQFHYHIGAKYLPELDYTRIYQCTAVAEAERFGRSATARRPIRDLATEALVPAIRLRDGLGRRGNGAPSVLPRDGFLQRRP
jgi:hypothetical protein